MRKRELSLETIERNINDPDWYVREAAFKLCAGRDDVPWDFIERGINDPDCDVREAAFNACQKNGIEIPIIRTIEPPALVYKKCFGGVIVVAEIPKDAQVRGSFGGKCRASKAIIRDIIGDFCGEKVGISAYDKKTMYFIGDEIEIKDFDCSDEECSNGFHFFCTQEEAENY